MWFRIKMPECIDESAGEEFIHPASFFRQKTRGFFIAFWIMNIDFFMRDIVISANNQFRNSLTQLIKITFKFLQPFVFEFLSRITCCSAWKISIDKTYIS